MADLISRLEAASEGSRELSAEVCFGAVRTEEAADLRVFAERVGCSLWKANLRNRGDKIPDYTTSLDAKLPGENIVIVYAPEQGIHGKLSDGKWSAAQPIGGILGWGYGKTEVLARRIAALRAMEPHAKAVENEKE